MIERIKDWWLTRRTGLTREEREYKAWIAANIDRRASTPTEMFRNFKHIVVVDYWKYFDHHHPLGLPVVESAEQYYWPNRPIGQCAVHTIVRGGLDWWTNDFFIHDLGNEDRVYVATNNSEDATMIALKYS